MIRNLEWWPPEPTWPPVICSKCGHHLEPGDWPWCKGNPEDHANPHYGWSMR